MKNKNGTLHDLIAIANELTEEEQALKLQQLKDNANYVFSVLMSQPNIVMCWGATRFSGCEYKNMRALRFIVNGYIHKGLVYICYNEGLDLFEIYLADLEGNKTDEMQLVYFDMLVDCVDGMVETKNNI